MKTFLLLLLSALATTAFSQNTITDSSATCVAYWEKGDKKTYTITRRQDRIENGTIKPRSNFMYDVAIKVLDATETGYTLEWTQSNYQSAQLDAKALMGINNLMKGLTIIYTTDETGAFTGLKNWEAVRDFWIAMAALSIPKDNKEADAAYNQAKAMFQSKESVEAVLIKEIQFFYTPYGIEFQYAAQVAETQLPNITGGEPFPATFSLRLTKIDTANDRCQLYIQQTVDKEKARSLLIDMMHKLLPSLIKEEEMEAAIKNVVISDAYEYTLRLSSGWMDKMHVKRTIKVSEATQLEEYTVEAKDSSQ